MRRSPAGFAVLLLSLVTAAYPAVAAEQVPYPEEYPNDERVPARGLSRSSGLDVDVWINKDEGGIYRPGESMRVYFRANAESYVLVFNVDTDGYIHLVYPYGPEDPPNVDGGRTYRVPARSDPYDLVADGPPGIEYVVAVASPFPFEDLPWYLTADRSDRVRPDVDDEEDDLESGHISGDPYVGIDRIVRRIAPPGREETIATSETYFYIGRRVEYPRYVCADCHYHPFYFDPYVNACSVFEIRVDATWAHYAPIRYGSVRPRYIYRVRSEAPTRYRQWKQQWSSLDGRTTLRTRFLPERDVRYRREQPRTRTERPEVRDLRRYREGRIWRGRDEILRLREQRDRVNPPSDDRARARPERPSDRGTVRDRGGNPRDDRGWRQREERRRPDEGNDRRERERPQQREERDNRERERPQQREERDHRERDRAQQREERDNRDRERSQQREERREKRDDRQDRHDRQERSNPDTRDRGNRDRDQGDHGGRGWWRR